MFAQQQENRQSRIRQSVAISCAQDAVPAATYRLILIVYIANAKV